VRLKAKVPLYCDDSFQEVIDFLCEPGDVLGGLVDRFDAFPDVAQLHLNVRHPRFHPIEPGIDGVEALVHPLKFVEHNARKALEIILRHIQKL
jgi:hypothetical protein